MLNAGRNRGMLEALVEMGLVALVVDENGRTVPALRVIVHTEEVECPPPPTPPCNVVINGLVAVEGGGVEIDIEGTLGTHVSLSYNYNSGENEDTLACVPNTGELNMGDAAMFLTQPNPTVFTVNASFDECENICATARFTHFPFTVYVPETGDDTVFTPTGLPVCAGVAVYTLFFDDGGAVDVELNEDGTVTIPAQTIATSGIFGYSMTCDGVLVASVIVTIANPPLGLRMVFDDIANAPVVDPTNVGQWNTFFDLPTNGAVFTSVSVTGDEVILFGGGAMTIKASAFINDASLIEAEDQAGIVIAGAFASFELAASLTTPVFPEMLTAATECFFGCTSVIVFDLPKLQTSGIDCFSSSTNKTTVTLPDLTAAAQNSFWGCTSATTFTLPALLATGVNCFFNCISCATFSFPLLKTAASATFRDCFAATLINIPLCVYLGNDPTDASVFDGCTNPALVLNIAAVNATNNAGGVHASIAALLIANPTATVNYI